MDFVAYAIDIVAVKQYLSNNIYIEVLLVG